MIHSVRELLWKGIGKSCFHCLSKKKYDYTISTAEKTLNLGNMLLSVVTYTQMLLQISAWYWTLLQIPEMT